jgi:hypothetical protein
MKVTLSLEKIFVNNEGDGSGNAEPFLWPIFFKIDDDTILNLGDPTVWLSAPNGAHENLGGSVGAGKAINIPKSIGEKAFNLNFGQIVKKDQALMGCLAVLLEEDDFPVDGDIKKNYQTFVNETIDRIKGIISKALTPTSNAPGSSGVNAPSIEDEVAKKLKKELTHWIADVDDFIGVKLVIATAEELMANPHITFTQSWNESTGSEDGDYTLLGSVNAIDVPKAVVIYEHADYEGGHQVLDHGNYNVEELTIGNDTLSSLKVPTGWKVTLFNDANFKGTRQYITNDTSNVGDPFNDQASSIFVEAPVTIFSDKDFTGNSQVLTSGKYNVVDIAIGNDMLSSLKVPKGKMVTLFEHANFSGTSQVLIDNTGLVSGFNDKTSSIVVEDTVVAYKDANFKGTSKVLAPGKYTTENLGSLNAQLSSLKIPNGKKVTLFKQDNFTGPSLVVTNNTPLVGNNFNEQAKSMIVEYIS